MNTHSCVAFAFLLTAPLAWGANTTSPRLRDFRAPAETVCERVPGFLWLEAEGFSDYGGWCLDTQFTHKMGSAYLLAVGVGKPIGAAKTAVEVPRSGTWHAWVRTKDWLPEFSPGTFRLEVRGASVCQGPVLGASKREGWRWERAGDFPLAAGAAEVALVDLPGAFARCDAVLLTTDAAYVPPEEPEALAAARDRFCGRSGAVADGGAWDVVVVGSGTAGMGAALSAARAGAKVALVHDRPVLGGNSSVELGVGTDGAAGSHPNRKFNARETGLCEEANLWRGQTEPRSYSSAYQALAERERNLTVAPNRRVLSVEKQGDAIAAVIARDTLTGERVRYRAKMFIDCTGDGWVGYFAGAEYMYGREARDEYGEEPAPEKRDNLTMSGCLMDGVCAYKYARRGHAVPYATPAWANVLPQGFTRRVRNINPQWWIEHGGRFDDLADPERARDELVRISFAYWGWLKNASPLKDDAANAELTFVPFMNGRREGMRLVGDYVLTANDALAGRMFEDRISYGGWPLDTHDPLGMENPNGNGYWRSHPGVPIYSIPYRCLYSRNVPNLMFAGRCQSVTHIALGSVRVEATLFTLGQAAGTAAALALEKGLSPREYGRRHVGELQQRLLKDDQYIPELRNEDPADLARAAKVTATSVCRAIPCCGGDAGARTRKNDAHELNMPRATGFSRNLLDRLEKVECLLDSQLDRPADLTLRVWEADGPDAAAMRSRRLLAKAKGKAPAKRRGFVTFALPQPVTLTRPYVWVELSPCKGVSWLLRGWTVADGARAYGGVQGTHVPGQQYSFATVPALTSPVDTKPEYVIDGVSRQVGECVHGWVSDPAVKLPQVIRLDFPRPTEVRQVRLTFDTNLTPTRVALYPAVLVRRYVVEGHDGTKWIPLAEEEGNFLRHRVHDFDPVRLTALRVTVRETWGDASARIFEIRAY